MPFSSPRDLLDPGIEHVSLSILVPLVCMPSSGIAGSYDSSVSGVFRNLYTYLLWLYQFAFPPAV